MILGTAASVWTLDGMKPSPHTEGITAWAQKMADNEALLASNMCDTIMSMGLESGFAIPENNTNLLVTSAFWYSGWRPNLCFSCWSWSDDIGFSQKVALKLMMGSISLGTCRFDCPDMSWDATTVRWMVSLDPDKLPRGEYELKLYGSSNNNECLVMGVSAVLLPADMGI